MAGVRLGTPAAEAAALLSAGPPAASGARASAGRRSQAFQLSPHDVHADREALEQLAQWCRQFAPSVSLLEPADDGPAAWDTLLLDISGCAHLFGGEAALAQRALAALLERGLMARVAVAETIGAAWAVAHAALLHGAGQASKPAVNLPLTEHGRVPPPGPGWAVVAPGELRLWLRTLPVEALRLPTETAALLHQLGVLRIEQLWQFPRAELASRLGPPLVHRIDEALSVRDELTAPVPLVESLQAHWTFDYPTARHEVLCGVLGRLAAPLLESLRQQTHGLRQAECWLRCQPAEFDPEHDRPAVCAPATNASASAWQRRLVLLSLEFFQPTASPRHVVEMFGLRLAERPLPGAAVELGIEVLASGPLEAHQQRLFADGPERESPRHVAQLIDRLSGRLGRQNVLRPEKTPDAQPENAYRGRPWVDQRSPALKAQPRRTKKRRRPSSLPAGAVALSHDAPEPAEPLAAEVPAHARPLWLCPRPAPVQVWSLAPDGPPERVRYAEHEHVVAYAWGPERIETGWQRRRAIGRDYYQVEMANGARWWLYRRHRDGRWFLHGWFG